MNISSSIQNMYPTLHERLDDRIFTAEDVEKAANSPIDEREVFDFIRDIRDPEHPLTLEELGVVTLKDIKVDNKYKHCYVEFTPTIPHCSMATLIGLAIKVQLIRLMPRRFKIDVLIAPGTHMSEAAVNKQLSDKERVAAALENPHLLAVINECLMLPEEQPLPEFVQDLLKSKDKLDLEDPRLKYILQCRLPLTGYRRWLCILDLSKKY